MKIPEKLILPERAESFLGSFIDKAFSMRLRGSVFVPRSVMYQGTMITAEEDMLLWRLHYVLLWAWLDFWIPFGEYEEIFMKAAYCESNMPSGEMGVKIRRLSAFQEIMNAIVEWKVKGDESYMSSDIPSGHKVFKVMEYITLSHLS